jgi:eukaryotic-like serine/threonine-protein kinase
VAKYFKVMSDPAPKLPSPTPVPDPTPATGATTVAPLTAIVVPPNPGETITSLLTNNTYTFGEKIGEGFFGLVFGCVDVWDNSLAVKVLKAKAPYEVIEKAGTDEFNKLMTVRHPHVTYVFDVFHLDETIYIVTERCHCPLSNLFALEGFDGKMWIKAIARCLLQAVNYLHLHGYVHQDIHLNNVFVSYARDELIENPHGALNFKLGDLGVAKLLSEVDATNTRAQWMLPPEVLDSKEFGPLDHRIDIYHCGLLFLHLLTGTEIRFTNEEILAGRPRALALQLPAPYSFALEKALRRHVAARTASAMELWRDLNSPPALPAPAEPEQMALPSGPPITVDPDKPA